MLFDSLNQRQTWQGRILQNHSNTKIIHPGIRKSVEYAASHPISFEDKNNLRKQLGINSNDFLLLSIGSFCPKKGQSLLVESAGSIIKQTGKTNLKVLIIGFALEKEKKAFYETCTYHERNAVGHGKLLLLEQEDISKYYAISDAFVMNTQNSGEPFGMVTIEALAFQLPILATNAGGTLEIIKDNVNGLLHPVGKQGNSILMNNIQLLMQDAVLRKKLGENGRSSAIEYFSSARFSNEFEKYLSEILSRSVSQN